MICHGAFLPTDPQLRFLVVQVGTLVEGTIFNISLYEKAGRKTMDEGISLRIRDEGEVASRFNARFSGEISLKTAPCLQVGMACR